MGKIKREIQKLRLDVGYDSEGERCGNCKHYQPNIYSQPAFGAVPAVPYTPRMCGLHGFRVNEQAICDDWIKRG